MVCHKVEIRLREHTHTHRSQGCFNVCHEVFGCEFDQLWIFPIINLVNDCAFVCVCMCVWRHTLRHEMRNVSVAIKRNERNKHGVKRKQGSNPIKVRNKRKWTENKGTYHSDGVRSPAGAAICLVRKNIFSCTTHATYCPCFSLLFFSTPLLIFTTQHIFCTPHGFQLEVIFSRVSYWMCSTHGARAHNTVLRLRVMYCAFYHECIWWSDCIFLPFDLVKCNQ